MARRTYLCPQGKLGLLPCQTRQASSRSCWRLFGRLTYEGDQQQRGQFCQFHVHPDVQSSSSRKHSPTSIAQGSNQTDGGRGLQGIFHLTQARDGQEVQLSPCHQRGVRQWASGSTGRRGFQTATEATKLGFSI